MAFTTAVPAHADGVTATPAFPGRVQLGNPFEATVVISNAGPDRVQVGSIELTSGVCPEPVSRGRRLRGLPTSVRSTGPRSCRGVWTVSETLPGLLRLVARFGEGTLMLRPGQTGAVGIDMFAQRHPVDANSAPRGVQTLPTVRATVNGLPVGGSDEVSVFPR